MYPRDALLLEIEAAKMRHEWAKAELRRAGNSPALVRFVAESLKELRILQTGRKRPDLPALIKIHQYSDGRQG